MCLWDDVSPQLLALSSGSFSLPACFFLLRINRYLTWHYIFFVYYLSSWIEYKFPRPICTLWYLVFRIASGAWELTNYLLSGWRSGWPNLRQGFYFVICRMRVSAWVWWFLRNIHICEQISKANLESNGKGQTTQTVSDLCAPYWPEKS